MCFSAWPHDLSPISENEAEFRKIYSGRGYQILL
jgi:hypothetical protein